MQTLKRFAVIRTGNSVQLKMELPFLVLEEKENEVTSRGLTRE